MFGGGREEGLPLDLTMVCLLIKMVVVRNKKSIYKHIQMS